MGHQSNAADPIKSSTTSYMPGKQMLAWIFCTGRPAVFIHKPGHGTGMNLLIISE
jgi:hypothetical protein